MANQKFNTGLSRAQITEAFRRALNDLTDDQITALIAETKELLEAEIAEKVDAAGLAAVATSGSYTDLSDTPETDAAPTENSTNAVQSGGVFAALAEKAAAADIYGSGTIMSASSENPVDLNDITTVGRYQCGQSASAYVLNRPISQNLGFSLTVSTNGLASRYRQTIYLNSDTYAGIFYERYFTTNGWTAWYKFTGEAVT